MPLNTDEILKVIRTVVEEDGMQATIIGVAKGTCIVSACAATGGFIGGPIGLSIGSVVGSVLAYIRQQGQYRSVWEIIKNDLTREQRAELAANVGRILINVNPRDVTMAIYLVMENHSIKGMIVKELSKFFKSEIGYQLMTS